MMKRHQWILVGILILQVVASIVVFWPRQAATLSGEPVFPGLKAGDIVSLMITDDAGHKISLRKQNDTWVLPTADDFPVKESVVTPILEKLATLNTATLVTRTDDSHKRLQVAEDNFLRRIDFETKDGETHTVFLGSAPRYTATHFRVGGQSETYLTTELSTWELSTQPSSWIDPAYTKIDQGTLAAVTLENANGTFVLVKDGENWTLADLQEGEEIAVGKTDALVRNASNLSILEPLGKSEDPSYGLQAPLAVVTMKTQNGETHTLKIGARSPDGDSYVVKYSGSPYYVRVASYVVSAMVENRREDFLKEPSTPIPTPAP